MSRTNIYSNHSWMYQKFLNRKDNRPFEGNIIKIRKQHNENIKSTNT